MTDYTITVTDRGDVASVDAANPVQIEVSVGGGGAVASVNGKTGTVVLTASDVGAATSAQGAEADSAVQPGDLATVATTGAYSDLTGKPTLGTAAPLDVPASGDAATGQVVKGNDSRLSNARTPTAHTHTEADVTNLTADLAAKAPTSRTITAGTGLTGGGSLAADRTLAIDTTAEAERIRDVMGVALVEGTGIDITVNDGADTITIAATGGGGGSFDGTMAEVDDTTVATPSAGHQTLFIDQDDHELKRKNSAGVVFRLESPAIKPAILNPTLGDDFRSASLNAKWTRVTFSGTNEAYQQGGDGSWMQYDASEAVGAYYYQSITPTAGDLLLQAGISAWRDASQMFGLLAVDSSGNGAGATPYSSPDAMAVMSISALAYGGSFAQFGHGTGMAATQGGQILHMQLRRTGTNWFARFSINGQMWSPWTAGIGGSQTISRIGFGGWNGSTPPFAIDYFDVL